MKNKIIFDHFTASTWMGMNLSRATVFQVPVRFRHELIEEGELSPLAMKGPFRRIDQYDSLVDLPEPTGVEVLDATEKSLHPVNMNHRVYIRLAEQYLEDSLTVVHLFPERMLLSYLRSLRIFFRPTSEFNLLKSNQTQIDEVDRFFNFWIWWHLFEYDAVNSTIENPYFMLLVWGLTGGCLFWVLGFFLTPVYGIWAGVQRLRKEDRAVVGPFFLVCVYHVLYVMVLCNLFEQGENNRFRFLVEAPVLCLLACLITDLFRFVRERVTRLPGSG